MTLQIIEQGPRNLVVRVDGAVEELIDVATLIPPCEELRLMGLQYNVPSGGSATVNWQADPAAGIAFTLNGHEGNHCFKYFGGIPNNTVGKTGNALIQPDGGTVVAIFKKVRVPLNWEPAPTPPGDVITLEDGEPLLTESGEFLELET